MMPGTAAVRAHSSWRALLAAALVLLGFSANVPAASIEVDPADSMGAVSALFRPSAMLAYADGEAIAAFLDLPGRLGTVRLTLEPHITESKSLPDYIDRLERATMKLTPLTSRGADIVFLFARTPRWLARTKDEALVSTFGFTRREATPPNDPAAFAELVYQTVGVINGKHGLAPWYEFWNEPDNDGFWTGTQDELFSLYDAFCRAARRADPRRGWVALR
jgi:hypothetical protein